MLAHRDSEGLKGDVAMGLIKGNKPVIDLYGSALLKEL